MEASELTLIEISAEDDSLLHQLPSNDVVSASTSTSAFAFDFSPLQTPRSNIPSSSSGKKSNAESSILGSGSSYSNKENLNTIDNKSGMRNLSVERQRMKKSRKGYNLRKSLAWDKAFFTEEGVLDSEELSMISGMSHVGRLPVIDEEPRDSLTLTTDVPSGSANIESLEENLFKELPSGQSSITYTSSSLMKRDSISGSSLSAISRSSQKAAANRGLRKYGSKPGVCSTPVAPSSQKRLLNTGTTKVTPRNSKIPRVPVSKHPPLMSTNMHAPLSGSHLKSPAIAQPAAQKSASLTLPSNIKSASKVASISSGGTSKSIKHLATNARKDSTCSSSEIGSSTNNKALSTGKVSNCLQNNSKQGLPVKMIVPVSGAGRSRVPSHLPSDNGDGHRKDAQSQGIKGSGLRMPSPSMRFFSEGNKKSSNLKSSIPTSKKSEPADHVSNFKQIKLRHGSLNHDAVSEKLLSSQVTELCSTASLVDPIEHTEAKHAERNQQVAQQDPLGDKVPQPTNNADDMKNPLNDIDIQCINENPTSLTVEERDMNKFVDINSNDSSLNQNRNADGNTMNSSYALCHKVQLTVASSGIGEVSPTLDEETGCSSSAINDGDLLESEIDFSGQHNNYTLATDSNPSTSMLYNEKNPSECMIDYLGQSNTEGNIDVQLGDGKLYGDDQSSSDMDEGDTDNEETRNCIPKCGIVGGAANEHVNKEQDDVMFNGDLSTTKFGECSIDQDNVSNHVPHNENNNVSSVTLKIIGSKEISDVDSILGEPESTEISNHSSTSFLKLSNNDADQLPYLPFSLLGPEEQPLVHGHEIGDIGSPHATSVSSSYGTEANINREAESTQEESDDPIVNLAVSIRDDIDLSNCVQMEDIVLSRHQEGSNIEISEDIHQEHSSVQEVEFQIDLISCLSDKGNNSTFHTDGSISAEERETNCNMKDICSDYDTEAYVNRGTELSQVLNDDSMVNLATSKRDELELNNGVLLNDCFLNTDQEGSNVEISDDIHQVHISVEGVETQTDSDSCLSSKSNNPTFQTDGSVSAEVPETKCDTEGICSIYGTEATINSSNEYAQVVNDDSTVNLATSKKDDIDLYNDVVLKDGLLKRDRGGSNIEISGDICQVHNCVEEVEFLTDLVICLPSNGSNAAHQIDDSVSAEEPESKCNAVGICSDCGTEATINKNIEFSEGMNDVSIVHLATSERDDMDLNNGVLLKDNFLKTDRGGSNIERSGDIHQVHSVSAKEPETNCNMEGICSDYGTEANINRDTELSQILNDDSMFYLVTSKRDELELNNGVLLKDCFLNTEEESNVEISDDIHQVHISVEGVETQTDSDSCLSSKSNNPTFQTDGSVSAEVPETKCDTEGICSIYGTEATINSSNEYAQVVNDDSTVNLATSKKDDIDLYNDVVLKDGLLKRDRGGSNIEISGDIWQVHNCVEEVEFLTDLVICLPSNGSNAAHQIDDSVSAEEPESKCNAVGICSDCGTEATINKNIEFSEGMNDVSIVHLATSERDDMDLNNGVLLKDNFLKTDRGGSNIERSGDIHQVHSVSAKEPETNCNMEGICSDYGTEANINRDTELSQILNDDSMFYLVTSKRDELELNNGVLLKDCFLNTEEESNVEISDDIHQVHISAEGVETQTDSDSCLSSKGNNSTFQTDGSVSAKVPEIKCDMEGICSIYGTEATINRSAEFAQVVNDDSTVNLATSKKDDIDLCNDVVLKDSLLKRDRGGSNIVISGDIWQVHNCVEEVEFLTDLVICLPSIGSNAAHQIDDSVSAEEPESKCNAVGIWSDCGTEATINKNIEFSEGMNDVSVVHVATSERDDMDLNNGVPLKDNFLKTDRGGSNIERSGDIHQVYNSVDEVEFQTNLISCLPSKGNNAAHQIDGSVYAEEPESERNMEGICSDWGTEATINSNIEFSQDMNDDSIFNLATSKIDDMDINNGVPLNSLLKTDTGGSNIEISGDIHQVHSSVEEVELHTDSVSCLSSNGNIATYQTDCSVFAEEYENKCKTESVGSLEEVNANLERTGKQNVSIPPPHAVPFSDEWLAAIESAGEEILTMKTGAVQHSPTEKSVPEPSPWSPVKRKTAQMIGPFDCTKHTHIQPDQSE